MSACLTPNHQNESINPSVTDLVLENNSTTGKEIEFEINTQILNSNISSITQGWRNRLKLKIWNLYEECSGEDWDGEGAQPITRESFLQAMAFIDLLMNDEVIIPRAIPESTGQIGLEWINNNGGSLSLSFTTTKIYFSGLISEGKKDFGEETLGVEKSTIFHLINSFFLQS